MALETIREALAIGEAREAVVVGETTELGARLARLEDVTGPMGQQRRRDRLAKEIRSCC